jgi:hypothetical protein
VLPLSFLILTNQSIKISVFLWSKGIERSTLDSISHFCIIVLAVLYVLHVLFEIPIFPSSDSADATSLGRFKSLKSSAVHPPFFPYFVLPLTGVGQNPPPAGRVLFKYAVCSLLSVPKLASASYLTIAALLLV